MSVRRAAPSIHQNAAPGSRSAAASIRSAEAGVRAQRPAPLAERAPAPERERWAAPIYFIIGQAAWYVCVLSAAKGVSWIGVLLAIALMSAHVLRAERSRDELKLLVTVILIGGTWESALLGFGLLDYPGSLVIDGLAPSWLLALWGLFAAQFNTTYKWLKTRIEFAPLLGAIAGPLSFRAGSALGAVRFAKAWPAVEALALGWAVLLPVIALLSRRWDGVQHRSIK